MDKSFTIALSGNPNAGKSTVFNAITGARQHIANYPGVTVEKKYGSVSHKGYEIEVVDLPGTYSLTAYSLEEIVARDFLVNERPEIVVDIVDASNLDRNLYLAVQFKELGIPLIMGLNMVDLAHSRGITIDHNKLSSLLGVPVVPMVARSNKGITELLDKVVEVLGATKDDRAWHPTIISYGMDIDRGLDEIVPIINTSRVLDRKYPPRWTALKCIEGDNQILEYLKADPDVSMKVNTICQRIRKHTLDTLEEEPESVIADYRYGYIAGITRNSVKRRIEARLNLSDRIDKVMTNRILGPVLMMIILYGVYSFTFWASEVPIGWLESFFQSFKEIVSLWVPEGIFRSMIVSGVIDGMGGVLGFVPLIMCMFFAIAIMEDSGYMARTAYMLDRILRWFGLHGNSVMSLIISGGISGGCAVPGVLAARTLRDPKERIATLLVVPFMNCGAKLPVYAVLIAAFFFDEQAHVMFALTMLSWMFALFAAKILRRTVLKGPKTPFVMELPPYRMPTLKGLFIHTWERTWQYIKKAGTIILGFSIILWATMSFPGLSDSKKKVFEAQRDAIASSLLASPEIERYGMTRQELDRFEDLYRLYVQAVSRNDGVVMAHLRGEHLFPVLQAVYSMHEGPKGAQALNKEAEEAALKYVEFRDAVIRIGLAEQQETLKGTIAGWIGMRLETITRPLGFDYRTNVALVGGFVAKEVVISTLGTAYSLGQVGTEAGSSLSMRLRNDPNWNRLRAFTFIVFTMLYVPCIATVISIKRESSWKWACFSVVFNLLVAYFVALIIGQAGMLLGLG